LDTIRILLVDDHTIFRAGIRVLLELQKDFRVVGEAEDGQKAITLAQELRPEIILMDVAMPGIDGLAATRQIMDLVPSAKVVLLTQHENREYIIPALKVGAAGYVLKRAAADELVAAIRAVHQGKSFLDPNVTSTLVEHYRQDKPAAAKRDYEELTEREREVLVLAARGHTNRQVAELLQISPKTVDFHCSQIMHKLGIKGKVALAQYAMRRGLID